MPRYNRRRPRRSRHSRRPKKRRITDRHLRKPQKRPINRYRLSLTVKIFWISVLVMIVSSIINSIVSSPIHYFGYLSYMALYLAEISGLYWIFNKLDRMYVGSDFRIWTLNLFSTAFIIIGAFLIVFSGWGFVFGGIFPFISNIIVGLGLLFIGSYLWFKFKRRAGIIVFRH